MPRNWRGSFRRQCADAAPPHVRATRECPVSTTAAVPGARDLAIDFKKYSLAGTYTGRDCRVNRLELEVASIFASSDMFPCAKT